MIDIPFDNIFLLPYHIKSSIDVKQLQRNPNGVLYSIAFVYHVRIQSQFCFSFCFFLYFCFCNQKLLRQYSFTTKANTSDFHEWNYHKAKINGRMVGCSKKAEFCCKTKNEKEGEKTTAMNQRTSWSMDEDKRQRGVKCQDAFCQWVNLCHVTISVFPIVTQKTKWKREWQKDCSWVTI